MTVDEIENATRYQVNARRNFLASLWASKLLDVPTNELSDYVQSVMDSDYVEPGTADVVRKIKADFEKHGKSICEKELAARLQTIERSVRAELLATD